MPLSPHCHPIPDLFFESNRISADLLIEETAVGAGLGLRIRNPVGAAVVGFFRGVVPGLFLYLGATPGVQMRDQGSEGNPGGIAPAPNKIIPGWALCTDSYCNTKLAHGKLPAGSPGVVANWHAVSLEVAEGWARGTINNATIFERIKISSSNPTSTSGDARCVAETTIVTDGRDIVGFDYRQQVLPGNSTADASACAKLCCGEVKCKAWAVAAAHMAQCPLGRTCCWLKTGGTVQSKTGRGEVACGLKPHGTPEAVPASGWAGLVSTLGKSQVDNFELTGAAAGGAAAMPCSHTGAAAAGATLFSTPCDFPGARVQWVLSRSDGRLNLRAPASPPSSAGNGDVAVNPVASGNMCIGVSDNAAKTIALVDCGSGGALVFNESTGRISPVGELSQCVTALQKQQTQQTPAGLVLLPCIVVSQSRAVSQAGARRWDQPAFTVSQESQQPPLPMSIDDQQFQHHPGTGILRPKGSSCISSFPGVLLEYRDCCIALC